MCLIFKGTRTLQNVNHMQMTADPVFSVFTPILFSRTALCLFRGVLSRRRVCAEKILEDVLGLSQPDCSVVHYCSGPEHYMDLDGRGLLWDCRHDALGPGLER